MYKNLVSRTFGGGSGIVSTRLKHTDVSYQRQRYPFSMAYVRKFVSVGETCPTVSYSIVVAVWLHRHSEGRSAAQMLPLGVSSKYG